jgi:hypothetical protein
VTPEEPKRRSSAAAPVAVAVLFAGLLLGTVTIVLPVILGTFLLLSTLSFLSTRLNPFSIGFYLRTKPSWTAIGVMFLSGILLFLAAWAYYVHGIGPLLPGHA